MAAFTTYNQAAHDYFTNTYVVKTKIVSNLRIWGFVIVSLILCCILMSLGNMYTKNSELSNKDFLNSSININEMKSDIQNRIQDHMNGAVTENYKNNELQVPETRNSLEMKIPTNSPMIIESSTPAPKVRELNEFERRLQASKKSRQQPR